MRGNFFCSKNDEWEFIKSWDGWPDENKEEAEAYIKKFIPNTSISLSLGIGAAKKGTVLKEE